MLWGSTFTNDLFVTDSIKRQMYSYPPRRALDSKSAADREEDRSECSAAVDPRIEITSITEPAAMSSRVSVSTSSLGSIEHLF